MSLGAAPAAAAAVPCRRCTCRWRRSGRHCLHCLHGCMCQQLPRLSTAACPSAPSNLCCRAPPPSCRPPAFYSSLRAELDEVGWRHVSSLADDLSHLTLKASDIAGRCHELRLSFPPAYPAAAPIAGADLPTAFELCWPPGGGGSGLGAVLRQFEAALAQHQQLWDSLDDLDASAWVIEPTSAPRRCARLCFPCGGCAGRVLAAACRRSIAAALLPTPLASPARQPCNRNRLHAPCPILCSAVYRRVALGNHVSLALTLDPAHPGQLPLDCRFMGSDRAVAPLRWALLSFLYEGGWAAASCLIGSLGASATQRPSPLACLGRFPTLAALPTPWPAGSCCTTTGGGGRRGGRCVRTLRQCWSCSCRSGGRAHMPRMPAPTAPSAMRTACRRQRKGQKVGGCLGGCGRSCGGNQVDAICATAFSALRDRSPPPALLDGG